MRVEPNLARLNTPTTMEIRRRQLRLKLIGQLEAMYDAVEENYESFLAFAQMRLPANCNDAEFPFVVRRLWMEDVGEPRAGWRDSLSRRYAEFVHSWWPDAEPKPDDHFLKRTLSVWQPRSPIPLSKAGASRIIENASRLIALTVRQ